jgi:transcription-repair coupling factor (superfamily II helicase)
MELPKLHAGKRFTLPRPVGSADALLLAELALREKAAGRMTAIVCADAGDARRLQEELALFAPDPAANGPGAGPSALPHANPSSAPSANPATSGQAGHDAQSANPAKPAKSAPAAKASAPAASGLRVLTFPDWETLPYDSFSPHQDLISERLATLWAIRQGQADVVLVPATTALYRLAPPSFLAGYTFHFKTGQQLDEAALKSQLTLAGYTHVNQVVSPGEYAVRGSLIDLFPMGSTLPYRVDLFDDEIDTIRAFDPDTQRSLYPVPEVRLLPGREFPMDDAARARFRSRWRELLEGDPTRSRIYKDMGNGVATAGIEYFLPLFFEQTASVFDYLGEQATLVLHGQLDAAFQQFWQDTQERHRLVQGDPDHPVLPPAALFLSAEQFYSLAKPHAQLALRTPEQVSDEQQADAFAEFAGLPDLSVVRGADDPLQRLQAFVRNAPQAAPAGQGTATGHGLRVLVLAESDGRRESLLDFLRASHINPPAFDSLAEFRASDEPVGMATAALATGFAWPEGGVAFVTETELFAGGSGVRRRRRQEQQSDLDTLIKDLSELKVGDPVVHSAHGIGRYMGLINMDVGQKNPDGSPALQEFLHLAYAGNSTLYVPVSQLHVIGRYSGVAPEQAPLHKLGGTQWEKAKRKAAEQVRDAAAELLNIYARRAAREGHAFRFAENDYAQFAQDFGFEETADQHAAITAVINDMVSPQPMDRLVCGDVGFGKTEVALRAAFVAVMGGKQVALLAPTTLLAEQHHQTLVDRFSRWPIKIAEMSRFRTAKEIKAAAAGLADGSVDVVVGTHKLLSESVQFKNLGLLIIDEEHRFGVRHKEAMKAMRAEVDVLTLTATPIPRTMGMALEGLRDLSVIATAPQRRLAIKTFVRSESKGVIREAVLRELKRGGQVYFLHNEVETIENRRQDLEALLPEARIAVAHGQMPERELEKVMRDFVAQRHNILLCSTIIETGIDVPSANTIVISRADKFGLAQLHQLRGRVGRSHHQAYAYLMVPDVDSLTKQAEQRLEAIQQMEELGSGFYLAMHDLEIRGAGEVLGENQSGNMMEVGFQLYNEMLADAVRALKAGQEPDLLSPMQATTEINLHVPALLPTDYCGDVQLRLSFYKRLATAKSNEQVDRIVEELVDRFGKLPPQAQALVDVHRLRVLSQPYGVQKVDAAPGVISITFKPDAAVEPMAIIGLIQKNKHIKLAGNDKLRIERELPEAKDRAQLVRDVLRSLGKPAAPLNQDAAAKQGGAAAPGKAVAAR